MSHHVLEVKEKALSECSYFGLWDPLFFYFGILIYLVSHSGEYLFVGLSGLGVSCNLKKSQESNLP